MALGSNDSTPLPNSFWDKTGRVFYDGYSNTVNTEGILLVGVPLVVLVVIFLILKKYTKKKHVLIWYTLLAFAAYAFYLRSVTKLFLVV